MLLLAALTGCGRVDRAPEAVRGPEQVYVPPSPRPPDFEPEPPPSVTPTLWRNGIWLERRWVEAGSTDEVVAALVRDLAAKGLTDLYVRTGPYRADGTIDLPDRDLVARMHRLTRAEGMRLWAWLPGLRSRVALEEPAVLRAAAESAVALAATGFDGLQFDIEPTYAGDEAYLALLDETLALMPERVLLGAATHLVGPNPAESEWTPDYFAAVARRLNQVAVMAYDTYAANPEKYREIVAYQTRIALERSHRGTEVLIGVPTYEDRTVKRTPETEPMSAALAGVRDGLEAADLPGRVTGWAIYAHWTTDQAEWQRWQERPWPEGGLKP